MPVRDTRHNLQPPPPLTDSGRAVMAQAGMRDEGVVVGAHQRNIDRLGTLPWIGNPLTGVEGLWPDLKTEWCVGVWRKAL